MSEKPVPFLVLERRLSPSRHRIVKYQRQSAGPRSGVRKSLPLLRGMPPIQISHGAGIGFDRAIRMKCSCSGGKKMCSSLNGNDIEFYFDFVFDLNGAARDAYRIYTETALLERRRTAIVTPV
jgi:hypothetical protein